MALRPVKLGSSPNGRPVKVRLIVDIRPYVSKLRGR